MKYLLILILAIPAFGSTPFQNSVKNPCWPQTCPVEGKKPVKKVLPVKKDAVKKAIPVVKPAPVVKKALPVPSPLKVGPKK